MSANKGELLASVLMLGDDRLILGHRLSEWCGHAPELEEDLGLANIALDLIGQAALFYRYGATLEGKGRSEDALAFLRDAKDFKNLALVEQPNGDFAHTILRQFFFDAFSVPLLESLRASTDKEIASISAKALKEDQYHLRHSREWVLRLGDGTEESHRRIGAACNTLWKYTAEFFDAMPFIKKGDAIKDAWLREIESTFSAATLKAPAPAKSISGGRSGAHEHLPALLQEMQHLQRTHPGAAW